MINKAENLGEAVIDSAEISLLFRNSATQIGRFYEMDHSRACNLTVFVQVDNTIFPPYIRKNTSGQALAINNSKGERASLSLKEKWAKRRCHEHVAA